MRPDEPVGWSPTAAHLRAVLMATGCLAVGVIFRRLDAILLGLPFLAAATWGALARPSTTPTVAVRSDADTLFEGQATTLHLALRAPSAPAGAALDDEPISGDLVTWVLTPDRWIEVDPPTAAMTVVSDGGPLDLTVDLRSVRWGRRVVGIQRVLCTSAFGAYRTTGLTAEPVRLSTLPLRERFAATDVVPRPAGVVGLHRSRRAGDGSEFADVRPFRPGDRLRRINWPVSSRTGELHVTSTYSDLDTEVMLLLDTEHDLGHSEGVDGRASSLDTAVRAAAAVAEHYLRHGDRVSLIDLGERVRNVPAGTGRRHLRRILDILVVASPNVSRGSPPGRVRRLRAGDLVIAFSPLTGTAVMNHIAAIVQRGHTVIVVDTLPEIVVQDDPEMVWRSLAWRIRLLERSAEIERLGDLGVPIVRWLGDGSLDEVLRDVSRTAGAPRIR